MSLSLSFYLRLNYTMLACADRDGGRNLMIGHRRQGLQWVRENSIAAPEAPPVSNNLDPISFDLQSHLI